MRRSLCMARPRGARRSSKSDDVRAATMYQASEVERRCSGPSWVSARIQADYRKDLEGPSWHPVSWLRRADRSSISSFHLADLGGEAVEPTDSLISLSTFHRGHVKPSPRSHRRSLARSDRIGERRWRRGRASIPLVNLSERISSSIDCDPWLVVTASCKHGPGDAREFVGERERQQIAMREALGSSFD